MGEDFVDILQCPTTGEALYWASDSELAVANGAVRYQYLDGVARLLPRSSQAAADVKNSCVHEFYESEGWTEDEEGRAFATRAFVDTRNAPFAFTRRCMRRLNRYFAEGGRYLLDAGSGPIPHPELIDYGAHFQQRVCVDLSVRGLRTARSKLGNRGVYLQADLTQLPIRSGSIDAVTCNHVIYQIPAENQAAVFRELWRVLKPGGIGVVVYWWREAPLAWRIERLARLVTSRQTLSDAPDQPAPPQVFMDEPQSLSWFERQEWPFRYRIESFRIVSNAFMRNYISDDWRGSVLLNALYRLQALAPKYCGRYGLMPVILIYKD